MVPKLWPYYGCHFFYTTKWKQEPKKLEKISFSLMNLFSICFCDRSTFLLFLELTPILPNFIYVKMTNSGSLIHFINNCEMTDLIWQCLQDLILLIYHQYCNGIKLLLKFSLTFLSHPVARYVVRIWSSGHLLEISSSAALITIQILGNNIILYYIIILEFQGPYGPLKNSSPCRGHARYARMASRFDRKGTLENLDFWLQTHTNTWELYN